jgi:hypothetical protein
MWGNVEFLNLYSSALRILATRIIMQIETDNGL